MVEKLEFRVVTGMDRSSVRERLQAVTGRAATDIRFSKPKHMYEGAITENGFTIRRIEGMRSLLPKLIGHFEDAPSGTTIIVETKLKEVIVSMIGMAVGLLLPIAAIFLTVSVIGTMKIVSIIILLMILGAAGGYVLSAKNTLEKEFRKDEKIITKILQVDD